MSGIDGEELYNLYKKELADLNVLADEFDDLDLIDQTAWYCVAAKLTRKEGNHENDPQVRPAP